MSQAAQESFCCQRRFQMSKVGQTEPGERSLRKTLASGILALVVAMGIGRFAYTPILPAMQATFGLSNGMSGALASSNYLGYLVGAILAAAVPSAGRQTFLLRASLIVVVLTTYLVAFTTEFWVWMAVRFVAGVASAGVFVFASGAILGVLASMDKQKLSGWLYSGVGLGIAISGVLVLALNKLLPIGYVAGWRADWIGMAILATVLLIPCWAWIPRSENEAARPRARPESITSTARRRVVLTYLLLLSVAYFLEGTGYIVSGTFLVKIIEELPGLGGFGTSAWILVGLAAIPSTVLWAWAASRAGFVGTLIVAYIVQAIGVVLPVLSGTEWAAALSAILFGGTFMGIVALTITYAREVVPSQQAARAIAVLTAAFGVGQVVGPLIATGLASGPNDFGPSLVAASSALFVSGLLMVAVGKCEQHLE
jgi:predicted MFS family arabinose efflux permease